MKNENDRKTTLILFFILIIPVVWAALIAAPFVSEGVTGILRAFANAFNEPLKITWCGDSLKCILIFIFAYGFCIGVYYATRRNYRRREEHGSAKWGSARQLNKSYADRNRAQNLILTQNVSIGLDGHKHKRNLNVMVVGGSGSGKTRFYAKPNVMQCNTSFVVLDPKGGATRS